MCQPQPCPVRDCSTLPNPSYPHFELHRSAPSTSESFLIPQVAFVECLGYLGVAVPDLRCAFDVQILAEAHTRSLLSASPHLLCSARNLCRTGFYFEFFYIAKNKSPLKAYNVPFFNTNEISLGNSLKL